MHCTSTRPCEPCPQQHATGREIRVQAETGVRDGISTKLADEQPPRAVAGMFTDENRATLRRAQSEDIAEKRSLIGVRMVGRTKSLHRVPEQAEVLRATEG